MQTITIELPDELVEKLTAHAASRKTTVSDFLTSTLQNTLEPSTAEYRGAFEHFKTIQPVEGFNAEDRLSREEANARR